MAGIAEYVTPKEFAKVVAELYFKIRGLELRIEQVADEVDKVAGTWK